MHHYETWRHIQAKGKTLAEEKVQNFFGIKLKVHENQNTFYAIIRIPTGRTRTFLDSVVAEAFL